MGMLVRDVGILGIISRSYWECQDHSSPHDVLPSQNENPSLYILSANVDNTEKVCAKNDLFRTRIEI